MTQQKLMLAGFGHQMQIIKPRDRIICKTGKRERIATEE
jgi:hypothetical protein